ncbi:MAG: hypothetical protein WBD27_08095 [Pyrinomonadaceae bacterium]
MTNENDFLNALYLKQAELNKLREPLDAEFERIAAKKSDLDSRILAIDTVIKEFADLTQNHPAKPERGAAQTSLYPQTGHGPPVTSQDGLKKYARANFELLPQQYTKRDVLALLQPARPGTAINPNTLSGVMRNLVDAGLATIKTESTGRSPQIYEKVS